MRQPSFKTFLVVLAPLLAAALWAAAQTRPATAPSTMPATAPSTQPSADLGPDVVVLKELMDLYEPVPFNHKSHAQMAEMWNGCVTCHHRSPEAATTRPADTQPAIASPALAARHTQDEAAAIPACKSCHPPAGPDTDIRMPNLKGAYHRQCLNCHREWSRANDCVICHRPRQGKENQPVAVTADDIVGRMHPPIPEPDVKVYRTRFTPADGGNVTFRHKEHVRYFGLKCASCHHKDNCSHCHDPKAETGPMKPVKPGKTWASSHEPCMSCHQQDRCMHCHYKDDQQPPLAFEHGRITGQLLDEDHANLGCSSCHTQLRFRETPPTCGAASCHKRPTVVAFPADRPGPVPTARPAAPSTQPVTGTTHGVRR